MCVSAFRAFVCVYALNMERDYTSGDKIAHEMSAYNIFVSKIE